MHIRGGHLRLAVAGRCFQPGDQFVQFPAARFIGPVNRAMLFKQHVRDGQHRFLHVIESDDLPVTVFINSPGGEIFSGFAIFDMLNFISCPVTTIVTGFAASMGSILSLAAEKGRRYAMPQAKIMIHQPLLMGYQGRATECEIQAREILKTRDHLVKLYAEQTGKNREEIKKALDRDNWFTAEEALEYGLIDKVVHTRSEI